MRRIILLIALFVCVFPLVAQTDRASLTGVILDPTHEAVAGATVNLLATATGIQHTVVSNSSGVYTFSALPVGQYTVSIQASGFDVQRVENITLEVGETRTLNLTMRVGVVHTSVTVAAATPDLNLSSAVVGGVISSNQIASIPVNGRYWATLESQIPGAISSGSGTQETIRFSGLSQEDNNFRLDGVDATGINHAYLKDPLAAQIPMDSIAEFRGSSALYSADVGGMAGGQISMVSKSGSNQFHGSFYEYLRNSYFDAKAFEATSVSPFRLNNFGVDMGGPIIRNKLFYFANYEGIRQAFDKVESAYVPTDAYRAEVAAKSPTLAALIDAFPEGTEATSDPNALLWVKGASNPTDEDSGLARMDDAINAKTSLTLRFNTDSYTTTSPGLAENTVTTVSTPNAVIDLVYHVSPKMLNDAKLGYNRDEYQDVGVGRTSIYSLSISPNFSYSLGDHSFRHDDTYSFLDDADFYHGRHTIKAGVEIRHLEENKLHPQVEQSLSYLSESDFDNNALDEYTYQPAGVETAARMTTYFGYILDEAKIRPNLVANVGLRYEYYGVDHDKNPDISRVFDPFTCGLQYCPPGAPFYYPNTHDFEPRISLGWSPAFLHDKTAIRAGFGMFYDNGQYGALYAGQTQIGQSFSLAQENTPGLSYPVTPYLGDASSNLTYSAADQHRKDLAMYEWTLSVQHELARDTMMSVTYVGSRGEHLFTKNLLLNGINPATGQRPYASLTSATIGFKTDGNNSTYNALQIGLTRHLYRGVLLSANYQYSHSINDGSVGGGESDGLENNHCRKCEVASSDFDVRHNFAANGIWTLPVGKGQPFLSGAPYAVNALLGGWQLSGIALARTGLPLNVTMSRSASALPDGINSSQRPDRVPGVPLYPSHRTAAHWLNPGAFTTPANGTWGDASRNAVRGPGIWQLDTGLQKQLPLREAMALSFRWEVFNVFNRDQIGSPATKWTAKGGTFGAITEAFTTSSVGTGTPRQMQFSLRFSY